MTTQQTNEPSEHPGPREARTVLVQGSLRLATLDTFYPEFLAALAGGQSVTADLSQMDEVDVAGLQLLCSVHRSFRARGMSFSICGGNRELMQAAKAAGFRCGCPQTAGGPSGCLWENTEVDHG